MAIFTLAEARALLPQVKAITQRYHEQVETLRDSIDNPNDTAAIKRVEQHVQTELQHWVAELNDLGVDVKGLWLADFDSGDGYYYCWKLGEADIEYFHRYETGFAGRRPITLLD